MRTAALQRLARGAAPAAPTAAPRPVTHEIERCDLCGEPLAPEHRHLLDLDSGRAECACRACAVLFDGGQAGGDHYRLIPERRVRLRGFDANGRLWAALGIPVDLAFVTVSGGSAIARYPSPVGVTTHVPAPDAWEQVVAVEPRVTDMEPEVEALLVRRGHDAWLLPIDDCFRLAALLREHWTGFQGGDEVWAEMDRFFARLDEEDAG